MVRYAVTGKMPPTGGIRPTDEQQACIEAFLGGENVTVRALAGSGKTSTTRLMSASDARRGLYLAYNKAIADEAAATFSAATVCKTSHSLAYAAIGREWGFEALRDRLNSPRVSPFDTMKLLGVGKEYLKLKQFALAPAQLARISMETVQRFCYSGDDELKDRHVPIVVRVDSPRDRALLAERVLPLAVKAWEDLSRPDGELRFSHDHYLKIWALSRPQLNFDYVLLDEAQDANGCLVSLLKHQNCQLVAIGDKFQQLYEWRGSTEAMDAFEAVHDQALTRTFRFGPAIADEANKWLELLGAELRIRPADPNKISEIRPLTTDADVVLCRTNASAVREVIASLEAGKKVALVGGSEEVVTFARAVDQLKTAGKTSHRDLFPFSTWGEVQNYVEESFEGADLKVWVTLVDRYGTDGLIKAMSACSGYGLRGTEAKAAEKAADLRVSTAHKAKGLEWRRVRISQDFEQSMPRESEITGVTSPPLRSEMMLAYVAVTRAQECLDRGGLAWVDDFLPVGAQR